MYFTLRWFLDLENTSLEQNLWLKTLDYLLFITAIFYLLFDCSMGNFWLLLRKQSHSPDVTHLAFGLSIFGPKVTRRDCVSTPNLLSSGLWSQWHNPLTRSPQIAEILSQDLHPVFTKYRNAPITHNSLTLQWPLGLHNTSLDAKFNAQNFSFCWSIKSMSQWYLFQEFP